MGQSKLTTREAALECFFRLNEIEKQELKRKFFPDTFIEFDGKWGYHYTFGQIEEMYNKTNQTAPSVSGD